MKIEVINAGHQAFYLHFKNQVILINPGVSIPFDCIDTFDFRLTHLKSDANPSLMYLLKALISYEHSRVELCVDGEYSLSLQGTDTSLKIRNYEYVFAPDLSYHAFTFNCGPDKLKRNGYFVPDGKRILKKYRFLYLFGGVKSLFPICIVLFLASLLCLLFGMNEPENIYFAVASGVCAFVLGRNYVQSLKALQKAMDQNNIRAYMDSTRIEHRTVEDAMVQKHLDTHLGNERYW